MNGINNLFLALSLIAALPSYGVSPVPLGQGIFNNPRCIEMLAEIAYFREDVYRSDAKKLGLIEPKQIEEYVARRVRSRYLIEMSDASIRESELSMRMLNRIEGLRVLEEGTVENRKEVLSALMESMGKEWLNGEIKFSEAAPYLHGMMISAPPENIQRSTQLKKLIQLKAAIDANRSIISKVFLELPMTGRIDELNRSAVIKKISEKGRDLDVFIGVKYRELLPVLLRDRIGSLKAKDLDAKINQERIEMDGLEKKILADPRVPQIAKKVILEDLDFNSKYSLNRHPLYKEYVRQLADYFAIGVSP